MATLPLRYRLLLFDFDGTLVDTSKAITTCLQATFVELGRAAPGEDEVKATIGTRLADTLRVLGVAVADLDRFVEVYRRIYRADGTGLAQPYPGTLPLLGDLKARGAEVVVVSNKGQQAIAETLARTGLAEHVSLVVGDSGAGPSKPDPAVMDVVRLRLATSATRGESLVIGDTATDLVFAARAGLDACWVGYGFGDRDECLAFEPAYVVEHAGQIGAVVTAGS